MDRQRLLPVLDQHWILGARDSRRIYRRAYPGEHTLPRRHRMFRSDLLSVGRHSRVDEPQRLVLRCRVPCAGRAPRRSNRPDFQGFHQVVSDHRWNLPGARRPGALVRAWCRCTKLPSGNWDFPPSSPCLSWSFLNRRQPLTSRALPYSLGPSTRPSQTPPTTANRQPHPAPRTRTTATARHRATPSAKHPTPFRQRAAGTWPRRAACDAVGGNRRAGPDRPLRPHAAPIPHPDVADLQAMEVRTRQQVQWLQPSDDDAMGDAPFPRRVQDRRPASRQRFAAQRGARFERAFVGRVLWRSRIRIAAVDEHAETIARQVVERQEAGLHAGIQPVLARDDAIDRGLHGNLRSMSMTCAGGS